MGSGLCTTSNSNVISPNETRRNNNNNNNNIAQPTGANNTTNNDNNNRHQNLATVQQTNNDTNHNDDSPRRLQQQQLSLQLPLPHHPLSHSSPRMTDTTDHPNNHTNNDHELNIPYTPTGEEATIYKYYCPLCMLYFKTILKSPCCGNYICFMCTKDYLHAKGIDFVTKLEHLQENVLLEEISCPHCLTHGFFPSIVHSHETIRDYSYRDQPKVQYNQPSPLRIGESFEDMKRKMIPFQVLSSIPSSSSLSNKSPSHPASSATSMSLMDGNTEEEEGDSSSKRTRVRGGGLGGLGGIAMMHDEDHSPMHMTSSSRRSSREEEDPVTISHTSTNMIRRTSDSVFATPRNDDEETPRYHQEDEHITRLLVSNHHEGIHTPQVVEKSSSVMRDREDHEDDEDHYEHIDPDLYIPDELSETMDCNDESCSNFSIFNQLEAPSYRHQVAENVVRSVFDYALHNHTHNTFHHNPILQY